MQIQTLRFARARLWVPICRKRPAPTPFVAHLEAKLPYSPITAFFVYGTLKRGQCRATMWPATPLSISVGWVRGALFARSDYPAMTAGDEKVTGELWRFSSKDVPIVIDRLDEIEGTNQPSHPDLYERVVLEVFGLDDRSLGQAFAYHYASDPRLDGFQPTGSSWP